MVLNNVTKFQHTLFKTVIFHKQRAITAESMVRYGPYQT